MVRDNQFRAGPNFVPKHKIRLRDERFWLRPANEVDVIQRPNIGREDLLAENQKCWDVFYSIKEAIKRVRRGRPGKWSMTEKFIYVLFCIAFKRIYAGQGMAADGVRKGRVGAVTRTLIKIGIAVFNHHSRKRLGGAVRHPWAQPGHRT
jgi:hypothetical protein